MAKLSVGTLVKHVTDSGPTMAVIGYSSGISDSANFFHEPQQQEICVCQYYDSDLKEFKKVRIPAAALIEENTKNIE